MREASFEIGSFEDSRKEKEIDRFFELSAIEEIERVLYEKLGTQASE